MNLGEYDKKTLASIEKALSEDATDADKSTTPDSDADCLNKGEGDKLADWAQSSLGKKVKQVKVSPPPQIAHACPVL